MSTLPELEDLLPTSGDLPDLENLLDEAVEQQLSANAVAKARERLKRPDATAAQREADRATIAKWERETVWRAVENVRLWDQIHCDCGNVSYAEEGHYLHSVHRTKPGCSRVERAAFLPELPIVNRLSVRRVGACEACAPASIASAMPWEFSNVAPHQ